MICLISCRPSAQLMELYARQFAKEKILHQESTLVFRCKGAIALSIAFAARVDELMVEMGGPCRITLATIDHVGRTDAPCCNRIYDHGGVVAANSGVDGVS
jgi:hypothetical protein